MSNICFKKSLPHIQPDIRSFLIFGCPIQHPKDLTKGISAGYPEHFYVGNILLLLVLCVFSNWPTLVGCQKRNNFKFWILLHKSRGPELYFGLVLSPGLWIHINFLRIRIHIFLSMQIPIRLNKICKKLLYEELKKTKKSALKLKNHGAGPDILHKKNYNYYQFSCLCSVFFPQNF